MSQRIGRVRSVCLGCLELPLFLQHLNSMAEPGS